MTRGKKIFVSEATALLMAPGVFVYGGWKMFGEELQAMKTLHMVGDSIYTFTFKGDYDFRAFLEQGGAKSDAEMGRNIQHFLSHGYMDGQPVTALHTYGSLRNLLDRRTDVYELKRK